MADLNSTDQFLVTRGDTSYYVTQENFMAELLDDDLMLVNRGDVSYKATGAEIKSSIKPPDDLAVVTPSILDPVDGAGMFDGVRSPEIETVINASLDGDEAAKTFLVFEGNWDSNPGFPLGLTYDLSNSTGGSYNYTGSQKINISFADADGNAAIISKSTSDIIVCVNSTQDGAQLILEDDTELKAYAVKGVQFYFQSTTKNIKAIQLYRISGSYATIRAVFVQDVQWFDNGLVAPGDLVDVLTFKTNANYPLTEFAVGETIEQDSNYTAVSDLITNVSAGQPVTWSDASFNGTGEFVNGSNLVPVFDGSTGTWVAYGGGTATWTLDNPIPIVGSKVEIYTAWSTNAQGTGGLYLNDAYIPYSDIADRNVWFDVTAYLNIARVNAIEVIKIYNTDTQGKDLKAIRIDDVILKDGDLGSNFVEFAGTKDLDIFQAGDRVNTDFTILNVYPSGYAGGTTPSMTVSDDSTISTGQTITIEYTAGTAEIQAINTNDNKITTDRLQAFPSRFIGNRDKFIIPQKVLKAAFSQDTEEPFPPDGTFVSSVFESTPLNNLSHKSSSWQVTTIADTNFEDVVDELLNSTIKLREWKPSNPLEAKTEYRVRVQYTSNTDVVSSWSDSNEFQTGESDETINTPEIISPINGAGEIVDNESDPIISIDADQGILTFSGPKDLTKFKVNDQVRQDTGYTAQTSTIINVGDITGIYTLRRTQVPYDGGTQYSWVDGNLGTSLYLAGPGYPPSYAKIYAPTGYFSFKKFKITHNTAGTAGGQAQLTIYPADYPDTNLKNYTIACNPGTGTFEIDVTPGQFGSIEISCTAPSGTGYNIFAVYLDDNLMVAESVGSGAEADTGVNSNITVPMLTFADDTDLEIFEPGDLIQNDSGFNLSGVSGPLMSMESLEIATCDMTQALAQNGITAISGLFVVNGGYFDGDSGLVINGIKRAGGTPNLENTTLTNLSIPTVAEGNTTPYTTLPAVGYNYESYFGGTYPAAGGKTPLPTSGNVAYYCTFDPVTLDPNETTSIAVTNYGDENLAFGIKDQNNHWVTVMGTAGQTPGDFGKEVKIISIDSGNKQMVVDGGNWLGSNDSGTEGGETTVTSAYSAGTGVIISDPGDPVNTMTLSPFTNEYPYRWVANRNKFAIGQGTESAIAAPNPDVTLIGSSFTSTPLNSAQHLFSSWQITAKDASFEDTTNPLFQEELNSTTNLTNWKPSTELNESTSYRCRVQYTSKDLVTSDWSGPSSFKTAITAGSFNNINSWSSTTRGTLPSPQSNAGQYNSVILFNGTTTGYQVWRQSDQGSIRIFMFEDTLVNSIALGFGDLGVETMYLTYLGIQYTIPRASGSTFQFNLVPGWNASTVIPKGGYFDLACTYNSFDISGIKINDLLLIDPVNQVSATIYYSERDNAALSRESIMRKYGVDPLNDVFSAGRLNIYRIIRQPAGFDVSHYVKDGTVYRAIPQVASINELNILNLIQEKGVSYENLVSTYGKF